MNLPFKVSNSSSCPSSTIRQGGEEEASNQGMYKRRTSDGTASTEDSYDSSVSSTESSSAASLSSPSLIHRHRSRPNHRCQLMNESLTGILKPSFVSESITKRHHADRYNIRVATFNFIHNLKLKGDGEETPGSCFSKLQSVTKKSVVSFCPTMEVYAYVQEGVSWTRE
jgi:hypothetical protein